MRVLKNFTISTLEKVKPLIIFRYKNFWWRKASTGTCCWKLNVKGGEDFIVCWVEEENKNDKIAVREN